MAKTEEFVAKVKRDGWLSYRGIGGLVIELRMGGLSFGDRGC